VKNFYEIDHQIVEAEYEMRELQAKVEGIIWVKYVAIAVGMGIVGWLLLMIPSGLIFLVLDWIANLFGGDIRNGPGTAVSWVGSILGWIGFLGGVALAVRWGISGANELNQRQTQTSQWLNELRERRDDYLRSSTD